MTLSGNARWLLLQIADAAGSGGFSGKFLEGFANRKTLQSLIDSKLIHADEQGRYQVTDDGQRCLA